MTKALACVLVAACGSSSSGTTALFELSPKDDYYELPFPNDLHRMSDGTLDLSDFPVNSMIVDQYRMDAETLDGWGLSAAISARFSDAIDPSTLPDPAGSMQAGASVYIVNVDVSSADYGALSPAIVDFRSDGTNTIGANRLVVRPYPGFPLDEATVYAMVITNRVKDTGGHAVGPSADFKSLLATSGGSSDVANARTVYAPLLAWLDAGTSDTRADVVSAAVFTTQHATFIADALRMGVFGTPAPVGTGVATSGDNGVYSIWTGMYVAPNFQDGTVPYLSAGGQIHVGSDGAAVVQVMENMRFALTVPEGPTPATGWPIAIYQHGTGGDWMSFIDDDTARYLAQQGIAVISTDQVLHGIRNPTGDPDVDFFNFANPYAARDNALQGAADAWSQMRLAFGLSIDDTANSRTITFDQNRLMFFGHSQGGLTGPPFIAFEPALKAAVLSGTGGVGYLSLLYKMAPVDFPQLVETIARDAPMDEDNPELALAQTWIERADGVNYAKLFVREPPAGSAAKNIFQTEGFIDTYAPDPCIEAFATSLGSDIVSEPAEKSVLGLMLRGRMVLNPPIMHNVANGSATAVLAQYDAPPNDDGHFVVFDVSTARIQSSDFLGTFAATGTATVVVPQ
ncbi:MAG TPA: hypothetical protein VMJ10_08675 [Kofleriaceae bacterium]|nr:hypothetical protein [Kofleriaceae bacterium]